MKQQFLVCLLIGSLILASISPSEAQRRGRWGRRGGFGGGLGMGGFGAGLLLGGLLGYGYGGGYGYGYPGFGFGYGGFGYPYGGFGGFYGGPFGRRFWW